MLPAHSGLEVRCGCTGLLGPAHGPAAVPGLPPVAYVGSTSGATGTALDSLHRFQQAVSEVTAQVSAKGQHAAGASQMLGPIPLCHRFPGERAGLVCMHIRAQGRQESGGYVNKGEECAVAGERRGRRGGSSHRRKPGGRPSPPASPRTARHTQRAIPFCQKKPQG